MTGSPVDSSPPIQRCGHPSGCPHRRVRSPQAAADPDTRCEWMKRTRTARSRSQKWLRSPCTPCASSEPISRRSPSSAEGRHTSRSSRPSAWDRSGSSMTRMPVASAPPNRRATDRAARLASTELLMATEFSIWSGTFGPRFLEGSSLPVRNVGSSYASRPQSETARSEPRRSRDISRPEPRAFRAARQRVATIRQVQVSGM